MARVGRWKKAEVWRILIEDIHLRIKTRPCRQLIKDWVTVTTKITEGNKVTS